MGTYKNNPVKAQNKQMRERYANHLCLHCKNLSYYDWYFCKKRGFTLKDYGIIEVLKAWKNRLEWLIGDASFSYIIKNVLRIDNWFIPDKPIRKCKFYEYSDRKVFWTKIVESNGTTWEDNGEDIEEGS